MVHLDLLLLVVGGSGKQLLDTALSRSWCVGEELLRPRRWCWSWSRRHRLLLGVLVVGEGAESWDLLLLSSTLDGLGLRLQQVNRLATLLYKIR